MDVRFTPEMEAKLERLASEPGRETEQYVRELVEQYANHDRWFRQQVQQGFASLDRGEFVEHDDVVARIEGMFRP